MYRNFLIYADSGAGKTVFAASGRRVLFLAPEDAGLLSPLELGYKFDKITVPTWNQLKEAYEWLYDNQDVLANYDWLVIDSITKMQQICMKAILDEERANRIARDQDPDQPQLQDYGKLYILLEKLVLGFNDLPVNVLYTSLGRLAEDPNGDEFLVPMIGSNKLKDYRVSMKIAAEMTSYGHFKVEVVEKSVPGTNGEEPRVVKVKQRAIYWEDSGVYRGKDRTTRLTPKTVLPARNALAWLTDVANGKCSKDDAETRQQFAKAPIGQPPQLGGVRKRTEPAKKAPAKKVTTTTSSGANDTAVAQTPVDGTESKGDEAETVDMASVNA
jgi:hypothetical protein